MDKQQIERIQMMEQRLNDVVDVIKQVNTALDCYERLMSEVRELKNYYESPVWRQDFEDDEAGRLPSDLPRGILSEDGIWDALFEWKQLEVRMSSLVGECVK